VLNEIDGLYLSLPGSQVPDTSKKSNDSQETRVEEVPPVQTTTITPEAQTNDPPTSSDPSSQPKSGTIGKRVPAWAAKSQEKKTAQSETHENGLANMFQSQNTSPGSTSDSVNPHELSKRGPVPGRLSTNGQSLSQLRPQSTAGDGSLEKLFAVICPEPTKPENSGPQPLPSLDTLFDAPLPSKNSTIN